MYLLSKLRPHRKAAATLELGGERLFPDLRDSCNSFGLLLRPVFRIRVPSFARF
jgi:hypothetical protein